MLLLFKRSCLNQGSRRSLIESSVTLDGHFVLCISNFESKRKFVLSLVEAPPRLLFLISDEVPKNIKVFFSHVCASLTFFLVQQFSVLFKSFSNDFTLVEKDIRKFENWFSMPRERFYFMPESFSGWMMTKSSPLAANSTSIVSFFSNLNWVRGFQSQLLSTPE